ncbi:cytochrome c [Acidobacteria bacterium AH-259-D05]|nr:cytochrome c [Acidobacteria bacterium AH-259-D05]
MMLFIACKRFGLRIGTIAILALLTSACLESRADQRPSGADEELARRLILTHNCGSCHTLQARRLNLTGKVGPNLTRQAQRGRSPDWLRQQITNPTSIPDHEVTSGFEGKQKLMPRLDLPSDRELNALVEFLRSLN